MISYPYAQTFTYHGRNYHIEIGQGYTIFKLGYNPEKEMYEQIRFEQMFMTDKAYLLQTEFYKEYTTVSGKVISSEPLFKKDVLNGELEIFDLFYGKMIRCNFINAIAEYLGIPQVIHHETFEFNTSNFDGTSGTAGYGI